ncbi:N-acetylmuramoyl-L-alanine amidase [Streptomyces sp. NPDC048604]|uniref:N-acetylmuramoyl-L-alanine amidase n=1 Tax=Streptomyces sp. NPDC048604 TaxID=3365578 RepID=UPI0037173B40
MAFPARRIPLAAPTAALTAAVLAGTLGSAAPASSAEQARPAASGRGSVHSIVLPDSDRAVRELSARRTAPFSMVGLTWTDARAQLGGTAQVRVRDRASGGWSAWRDLDSDVRTPETGRDSTAAGVRAGTQPLWTGPADGVQARVRGASGKASALPDGLRIELVAPTATATAAEARTATAATVTAEAKTVTPAPQPAILPRSAWGADETLVKDPATYSKETKVVFVHHTAGTNTYACEESASVVNGIFLYHVQSQGWNDIGYQFLVDKCGTVYEGRAGGIDKPVIGAQTYGFNTDTTGVAVLGNYNDATSTPEVRASLAAVAAWKLGLYGYDPTSTVVMTAAASNGKYTAGQQVAMNRISGHRDGFPTECPGNNLYADLPTIRTLAVQ